MPVIPRPRYVKKLMDARNNGRIKIITGLRRCGKSFLLFNIFKGALLLEGTDPDNIIEVKLDRREHERLRNPNKLYEYVLSRSEGRSLCYVFIDEIQLSYKVLKPNIDLSAIAPEDRYLAYTTFYDVLNDFMGRDNLDVYVTGSNSRMLSSDIATNFRDRGYEIPMAPLSFSEFHAYRQGDIQTDWQEYLTYGGMPLAVLENDLTVKQNYLTGLFEKVYRADIVERYGISNRYALDCLVDALSSAVGSLTNPSKLANSLNTAIHAKITDQTVKKYLDALEDSFLFKKAGRWDVKGKRYFDYPMKYYAGDVGLRNARLNFRQLEETHLMENIIFNELHSRGFLVDTGAIRFAQKLNGKKTEAMHEIDFVINRGAEKYYIQSALSIDSSDKKTREVLPLLKTGDFFKKILVVGGSVLPHPDENGVIITGITPFLLDESLLRSI